MRTRFRAGVGTAALWSLNAFVLVPLLLLGSAIPSQAQVEPESFTSLRAAVNTIPPNAVGILDAIKSWKIESDLAEVWANAWASDPTAFDAFDGCFAGGDQAKESARRLIKCRKRTLSENEVKRAASNLLGQLDALPAADRQRLQEFVRLADKKVDKKAEQKLAADKKALAAKLKAAVALGEIKIELKPMVPSKTVTGIRWSPKGNKIELFENDGVLSGELEIGKHKPISLELEIDDAADDKKDAPEAVLKIDLNNDEKFSDSEIHKITASESRGNFWYSAKATINLHVDAKSTRPYPISLWHVVDPAEKAPAKVIRWSRRGWHEGQFKINKQVCTAVITDADSDGLFTAADAWGLGESPRQAYAFENSTSKIAKHAWLDSVAWQITDSDEQGRFIKIRALDLGMTQAEDRARKDPYAADRKYARSKKPVTFLHDFEEAKALAKKEDKRMVVDFVTTWCGPCRVMDQLVYTAKPVVEKSSELVFVKLDGDEQKKLNDQFEVKGYPTLILLDKDGTELRRAIGYQSVKELLELIK
jgi:thiol-disulfide isomerase/thioredoxin